MCSLCASVPPRYRYLYAAAAVCVRLYAYVCVCVCSDTPQGERACHDNKKSTLKKAQSQSLNSKNKLLHVHFWLTIHAKVETALKFRRHLNPKP